MQPSRTAALPYPARVALSRWRGGVGMIVGVGLAVGIGMTMLAVSQATIDLFTGDYRASGVDLYAVTHGGKIVRFLPSDSPGTIENARAKLSQVRELPGAREALGVLMWPLQREIPGRSRRDAPAEQILTVGVDGDPTQIGNSLLLARGRWLRRTDEIVIGTKLAREKVLDLGSSVRLSGRDFTVVGVGRLRGISYTGDAFAYVDARALRQRASLGDVVNLILVDSSSPAQTLSGMRDIRSLDAVDREGVISDVLRANDASIVLRWILVGLTLAIAGLFVANMLSGSVAARRVEFATLRALGVPGRTVVAVVAAEALLICILAGVVGVGFSAAMGELINQTLAPMIGSERLYVMDKGLFAAVLGMVVGLGLVSGTGPARQAASVDPVEVLREV